MAIERIKVNLIPTGTMPVCHASQYDKGRKIGLDIYNGLQPYILSDETVELDIRKSDGRIVTLDVPITARGNSVVFETTEQMCAVAGANLCELRLIKNGTDVGSANFSMQIERSPMENGLQSESEINNLNRQIDDHLDDVLPDAIAEEIPPIVEQVIGENYPTKQEVNQALEGKADATATAEALNSLEEAIPTKTSELTNDSDFATMQVVEQALEEKADSGTVEDLEDEVEAIKDGIDEYVYTLVPYDRQLFDWETMTPDTPIRKMFNSNNLIVENTSCRLYFIEIEGKADEYYSFNIINPDNFHANALYMFASNSLDAGASVKAGSTNIDNKRGYVKLDGSYRYVCFAISSTLGNQDAITAECNDIVKKLVIRRSIGSVGYDTTYYSYEAYPVYKVDVPNDFEYRHSKTLLCGDNLLLNDASTVGAGWSGTLASGYTHSSGSNELVFSGLPLTNGKKYVVIFDATGDLESWLFVKLGSNTLVDVYNGITSFAIGFVSDGTGTLTFKPTNQFAGTVSNIEVREVGAGTNEIVLPKYENIDRGLEENVTGFWNTSISPDGLQKNINGTRNVAIGLDALRDIKTGNRNIGIGTFALNKITSGDRNVAIGSDAAYMTTKTEDTVAIGYAALINGGDRCIAIGTMAANGSNGSAQNAVAIGHEAAWYAGSHTVAIGYQAGYYLKGTGNVSIGKSAGNTLYVTGERNVCIGREASFDGTGSTASNPKTINNSIAIGNEAKITKSNQVVIGSSAITEVVFCGNKKINFNQDGTVTWETLT